jgi:hypothetical protein
MKHLTRFFFTTFLFSLISLFLFIAITYQQDPQKLSLFGGITTTKLTFIGLVFLAGLSGGTALIFWKNPDLEQKAELFLKRSLKISWLPKLILSTAAAIIVTASIPMWDIIILGDERLTPIIIRYFPVIFLAVVISLKVMGSEYLNADRRLWGAFTAVSVLLTGAGILLQASLLEILVRPYEVGVIKLIVSQYFLAMVSLFFTLCFYGLQKQDRALLLLILLLVAGLFVIQWVTFPKKLWALKPTMGIYAPIMMLGLPLLTKFMIDVWRWLGKKYGKKVVWVTRIALLGVLVAMTVLYVRAATKHSQVVNVDTAFSDQHAYMNFIKEARRFNFKYTGDHNRMPGYPFLQALFYRTDMSDQDLFEQGKQINLILSLILLGFLFLAFLKLLGFYQSYLLILIITFSLFIFKASYIQAEILYYFLAFFSFILMLGMLVRPTWLLTVATGVILGLAYLTKATILSSLILFVVVYGVKLITCAIREFRNADPSYWKRAARRTLYLLVVMVLFTAIIFPYIHAMKQRFGHYLYNVNTTFYIWYDNWDVVLQDEAKHHFTESWPSHLSEDQLPSLQKYLRDHTTQQIMDRFRNGVAVILRNIYGQFSVTNYQISYLLIFLIAILINVGNSYRTAKKYPYLVIFTILYFVGYFVAFAWYTPLSSGRRFTFAFYMPYLVSVFMSINELAKNQKKEFRDLGDQVNITTDPCIEGKTQSAIKQRKRRLVTYAAISKYFQASNLIMFMTLLYNIWLVTSIILFYDRYGS